MGDTVSRLVWDMVGFRHLFFYTDVCGISVAAGTLMLVARPWDRVVDPITG